MARKAGSIVLDRLRERILLGRYFGCWSPGDRLPSVRDVARLEDVDRKTAAAAYRQLQREQLVRVEARSGVYLEGDKREEGGGPLQRLHRQWLEQALSSATELGLSSEAVARMLQGVAAVEGHRIPVVDDDPDHATLVAREVNTRTGLDCGACRPPDLPATAGPLKDAPFVIATPVAALQLRPGQRRVPVVQAVLAPELLDRVRAAVRRGRVVIIVGTRGLHDELTRALDHGLVGPAERVDVVRPASGRDVDSLHDRDAEVVVWPGAPDWVTERMSTNGGSMRRAPLLADGTFREVRRQVARAALDYVSRSSVA